MKAVVIMCPSSIEFWLNKSHSFDNVFSLKNRKFVKFPDDADLHIDDELAKKVAQLCGLKMPLHIMAKDAAHRNKSSGCKFHVRPKVLTSGSLIKIESETDIGCEIYMSSPEFTFLQAAARRGTFSSGSLVVFTPNYTSYLLDLIILGTELCSMYVHDDTEKYNHKKRDPICCVQSILNYLENATGAYGISSAKRAAKFISNNSNSPVETFLIIFFTLPTYMGGLNLPKPILNGEIKLKKMGTIKGDFVWWRTVCEYDSDMTHLDSKQHAYDEERQNALIEAGYKVVRITGGMLKNFKKAEEVFTTLRLYLGKKNTRNLNKYEELRRRIFYYLRDASFYKNFVE